MQRRRFSSRVSRRTLCSSSFKNPPRSGNICCIHRVLKSSSNSAMGSMFCLQVPRKRHSSLQGPARMISHHSCQRRSPNSRRDCTRPAARLPRVLRRKNAESTPCAFGAPMRPTSQDSESHAADVHRVQDHSAGLQAVQCSTRSQGAVLRENGLNVAAAQ